MAPCWSALTAADHGSAGRDVMAAHLSDLGGVDNISEAERSIVRRAPKLAERRVVRW